MSAPAHIKLAGLPLALTSRTFGQLVVLAVVLGFVAVMAAGGAAAWAISRDQALTRSLAASNSLETGIADVLVLLERTEAARRGYILTRDPVTRATFQTSQALIGPSLNHLDGLVQGDPAQKASLKQLRQQSSAHLRKASESVRLVDAGAQPAAVRLFVNDAANESMREMRGTVAQMALRAHEQLKTRQDLQQESVRNLYLALGLAAPLLVLVAIGSTFVIFRYTNDLATTGEVLRQMNEGLEEAVADRTAGLERANAEIQRFAYIVSHDLRSPLVNVMGFTAELETSLKPLGAMVDQVEKRAPELLVADAAVAVREEVPEAIAFIRKSTQKMDRLINAILELSRNGRRPLKPRPLDMNNLVVDVLASLKTRADAAGAEITVQPNLPPVVSDSLAIEQVFANLLENALKYLKPGRPGLIEIGGELRGARPVYWVRDNGRGIDPKDHERIFELFRRSGVQDQPGEGIGLANVRAIVYRLGGFIECDSAVDQGAVFRISLPPVLSAEEAAS